MLAALLFCPCVARGASLPPGQAGATPQQSAPSPDAASRRAVPSTELPAQEQQQTSDGRIVGVVTAAGEPVIGATVEAGGRGTVSGKDGSFTIESISGEVTLTVRMIGHETWTRSLNVAGETNVAVELTSSIIGESVLPGFDRPVRWDWLVWALLLMNLIGFEIGLRNRRSDPGGVRGPAIAGVTVGSALGRTLMLGYYLRLGIDITPGLIVENAVIVGGTALTAGLVLSVFYSVNGTAARIWAGAGAGLVSGAAVGTAFFIIWLTSSADPLAISISAWAGAVEGALLAAWLTLRPVLAKRSPAAESAATKNVATA
jgi:hypothetical protein